MSEKKPRVGILGGSFNPAHDGHLHISRLALDRLGLDELWWLVSPQNPLKAAEDMAPYAQRLETARAVAARDGRIRVSDFEHQIASRYTIDTLTALKAQFPDHAFVWIIGADNLRQMPRWRHWSRIFRTVPIAVFPRAPYSLRALRGRAARRFKAAQLPSSAAARLVGKRAPAWVMLQEPLHGQSATSLRRKAAQNQAHNTGQT